MKLITHTTCEDPEPELSLNNEPDNMNDVDEDISRLGGRGWRRVTQAREDWRYVILEARALHEL